MKILTGRVKFRYICIPSDFERLDERHIFHGISLSTFWPRAIKLGMVSHVEGRVGSAIPLS